MDRGTEEEEGGGRREEGGGRREEGGGRRRRDKGVPQALQGSSPGRRFACHICPGTSILMCIPEIDK